MRWVISFVTAFLVLLVADKLFGIDPTWKEIALCVVMFIIVILVDGIAREVKR